jgi:transcriptional regulator with XRE-family HTH domain
MNLRDLLEEYKYDSDFIYEGLILDIATQIKEIMKKKGVTKKQLAQRMNVKPSYITKILSGQNISLKTLAKILGALEVDATISINELPQSINKVDNGNTLEILKMKKLGTEDEVKALYNIAA